MEPRCTVWYRSHNQVWRERLNLDTSEAICYCLKQNSNYRQSKVGTISQLLGKLQCSVKMADYEREDDSMDDGSYIEDEEEEDLVEEGSELDTESDDDDDDDEDDNQVNIPMMAQIPKGEIGRAHV